jgi:hypothetical protein
MSLTWVLLAYGSSFVLAVALLYFFRARWYWHVLSVLAALGIGSIRFPAEWRPPDLAVGFVVIFLLVWGIGAPFVPTRQRRHIERHA